MTPEDIWCELLESEYVSVDDKYDDDHKTLIIKIYENDIEYVKDRWINNGQPIVSTLYQEDRITDTIKRHECFLIACLHSDLTLIEYIIKIFDIDIKYANKNNINVLRCACANQNLSVIKFLVENGCDVSLTDSDGFDCLSIACTFNTIDVVKYLINQSQEININKTNKYGQTYLSLAAMHNDYFAEIITYLIENTNIKLTLNHIIFVDYAVFVPLVTNYYKLNELLRLGLEEYPKNDMIPLIRAINPFLLYSEFYWYADCSPFRDYEFNDFYNRINKLNIPIPIQHNGYLPTFYREHNPKDNPEDNIHDFTNNNVQVLFKNNGIDYYGYRTIVYGQILIFNEIKDTGNFDDPVVLEPPIPRYLMNMYIQSTHTNRFDTDRIISSDFVQFIKFIDKYPTRILSMEQLEYALIDHITKHGIDSDNYLESMCIRYKLKYMYAHIHNLKLI